MPRLPAKPGSKARVAAHRGGLRGEALAALFLQLKFYRILERRYKTPVGEIDLVAARGDVTVFVEVKTRSKAATEAETLEAINQRRIVQAAQHWLSRHPAKAETAMRFDVIFLAPGRWPRHVINAFDAG